jgi:adenine/guanine phosphoribosyltransferase-like PRPP-binding protein
LEKKASQGSKCYKVQSSEAFQVQELKYVTSFRIGNNSMLLVSTVKDSVALIAMGIDVIVGVYLVIFN